VRIILGVLVAGLALGGAVLLHEVVKADSYERAVMWSGSSKSPFAGLPVATVTEHRRADWQDALAIVIVVAGIGAGVTIVIRALGRRCS
jgi:hypothetical protein